MEGDSCQHPCPTLSHLFEEENRKAQELLEAAAQRQEQLQQKCQQLQQKRQRWAWSPSPESPKGRWLRESLLPSSLCLLVPLQSYPSPSTSSYPTPDLFLSRLKEELEKLGVQVPAQAQSKQEEEAGLGEAVSPGIRCREQRACERSCGWEGTSEDGPQGRAFPMGHIPGKSAEAGSGGVRRGRTHGGCGHRDLMRLLPQTLTSHRPIPSPLESVRIKTQSHPPRST